GAAAFFVLDTRTMRIKNGEQSCILGERQWGQLQQWLLDSKDRYPLKFIVSSGAVLCNLWGDLARDRWSGFPADQRRLLSFLAVEGIEGVFLLTGDMHSAHAVRAELYGPAGKAIPLWELCSSPFEQNPNWAARFTYATIRGAALKNQVRKFVVAEPNFGIVRVAYDASGAPEVRFEVYNRVGECLKTVDCMGDQTEPG
ncbi:MAG TPA: alkaline phosphatase D family protein, partial [Anaerolineales bacterium]|nr:alkaline phosphatase D family protein [Anaerolineales bacterium]